MLIRFDLRPMHSSTCFSLLIKVCESILQWIFEKKYKFIICFFNNPFAQGYFSLMPLSFWFLVHVDIELTTYLPYVDNRGHLTDHLPTSSCPRSLWMAPYQEWMIFARIEDVPCYYLWNEICAGVFYPGMEAGSRWAIISNLVISLVP